MNAPSPGGWSDQVWRSAWTLLLAVGVVYVASRLFSAVWPFLLIIAGLVLVIRIAIGAVRGRSGW